MAGDFNITSGTTAAYKYPGYPITLNVELSADKSKMTFTNSMYSCNSYAVRTSGGPNTAPATVNMCAAGTGGSTVAAAPQSKIVGSWLSDRSCKPTEMCCCIVGATSVILPGQLSQFPNFRLPAGASGTDGTDGASVYVYGGLDGGLACLRRTNISGICKMSTATAGSCKLGGIQFSTRIAGNRLSFFNPGYTKCVSVSKYVSTSPLASVSSSAAALLASLFDVVVSSPALLITLFYVPYLLLNGARE